MIDTYLKFLDRYSLEDRLYFRVGDLYRDMVYEIEWRLHDISPWRIRPLGTNAWAFMSSSNLVANLNQRKLDLSAFERDLSQSIYTQISYADMVLRGSRELLGADSVSEAIARNNQFMDQIEQAIKSIAATKHTQGDGVVTKLKIVESSKDS